MAELVFQVLHERLMLHARAMVEIILEPASM